MKHQLIILSLIILLVSCSSNEKPQANYLNLDKTLRLDNGKKWKATGSMVYGMNKMNTILTKTDTNTFNPKIVGYKLNLELSKMMSMCTATGEAHDQFHYYLNPLQEQINGLRIANEIAKEPLLTSIKVHLKNYNNYFN